ncbi:hypothetical protein BDK51DRAFT_27934 [Blyttiomyces helicus]|uniref:C2H2-type domain-containing protein n=1 Tax=Blyttiomyces helicus TaxID=388810 RepID=A0A4P9WA63_9FUNG|nr:hypothetical protein BDK51DRAFT_27934 [Blyttiomyces helicus]|eukprot:RKO89469.1 hypothetical protein BDK51DRAFT_27934 [Blyttiomyces helicus]
MSACVVNAFSSPQRCPYEGCTKSFATIQALRSHWRCHGERTFECEACSATFRRKHDLLRHIRSLHVVDKPHQCEACDRSYARADGLRRHREVHHRGSSDAAQRRESSPPAPEAPSTPTLTLMLKPEFNCVPDTQPHPQPLHPLAIPPPSALNTQSHPQPLYPLANPPPSHPVSLLASALDWDPLPLSDPTWIDPDASMCPLLAPAETPVLSPMTPASPSPSPSPSWPALSLSPQNLPESPLFVDWSGACGVASSDASSSAKMDWEQWADEASSRLFF